MSKCSRRGFLAAAFCMTISSLGISKAVGYMRYRKGLKIRPDEVISISQQVAFKNGVQPKLDIKRIVCRDEKILIVEMDEIYVLCHRINGEWRVTACGGDSEKLHVISVKLGDTIYL